MKKPLRQAPRDKAQGRQGRPNIIWFIVDQMSGHAMGCNGDPNVFTPNLDNMSICGTNFSQAVSGYPLCCPFRGSMMTGKYAHNHSVKLHEDPLDSSFGVITDVFNDYDYETIYLGKWHLGGIKEGKARSALQTVPRELRGRFDTWLGYDNNNSQWDTWIHGHDGDNEVEHYRLPGYETDCLTDMALDRIEAMQGSDPSTSSPRQSSGQAGERKPFFMVISVQPPHRPGLAPSGNRNYQAQQLTLRPNVPKTHEAGARTQLSGYYAQIENIDDNVGRLVDGLRDMGMLDDTHIMFFSDHGDQMGSQGRFGKCVPFEESMRVPFMIGGGQPMSYDGTRAGKAPSLINHVDIAPTTLGLCGIDVPDWMEGFDYSHRRTGVNAKERIKQEPDSAYCQLIGDRESGYAWRSVVTRDGWKYACVKGGDWMLYNLKDDPYEQNNLAFNTGSRKKRNEMRDLLKSWIDKTGDEFELPTD